GERQGRRDERQITEAQVRRLWAIARQAGVDDEVVRRLIWLVWIAHSDAVIRGDYDRLVDSVRRYPDDIVHPGRGVRPPRPTPPPDRAPPGRCHRHGRAGPPDRRPPRKRRPAPGRLRGPPAL